MAVRYGFRRQDLYGDFAIKVLIVRAVNITHPAGANLLDNPVAAQLLARNRSLPGCLSRHWKNAPSPILRQIVGLHKTQVNAAKGSRRSLDLDVRGNRLLFAYRANKPCDLATTSAQGDNTAARESHRTPGSRSTALMQQNSEVISQWSESAPYWEKHREIIGEMFAPVSRHAASAKKSKQTCSDNVRHGQKLC